MITETGNVLLDVLTQLSNAIIISLPGIVAGLLILFVGYIFSVCLGTCVRIILKKISKLDKCKKLVSFLDTSYDLPYFIGTIVHWYVFVLFLPSVATILNLGPLSNILLKLSLWIPNFIIAIVIAFVGYHTADYIGFKIKSIKGTVSIFIGDSVKIMIFLLTLVITLTQIGIAVHLAENSFLVILAGIMLAFALAFGLGGREEAKSILKKLIKFF